MAQTDSSQGLGGGGDKLKEGEEISEERVCLTHGHG